jgi:hypothetical protein
VLDGRSEQLGSVRLRESVDLSPLPQ